MPPQVRFPSLSDMTLRRPTSVAPFYTFTKDTMTTPLPYGLVPQDILDARETFDDDVLGEEVDLPESKE